jgi:DNA-binding Lrp family transcriptional regulator
MSVKLDLKDRKLLYELDTDSRQSASQLAKKVGISKQGTTYAINNLLKKGVITNFTTVINTAAIGRLSFRIYLKLVDITPQEEDTLKNFLINHPLVPWVVGCEGIWDIIIVVFPSSFAEFEFVTRELTTKYGKCIEKKEIALVTRAHHFRSGYILEKKRDLSPLVYAGQPQEVISLDETDKHILALLAKNARMPLIDISRTVRLSAQTTSARIHKLEKQNIIEGYTTSINYGLIGYERYKVFIRAKNINDKKEKPFIEFCRLHPNILYYSTAIGTNDIELEVIVPDSDHLRNIIATIREHFQELIKSYETLKIYKEYKLNFFPWYKEKEKKTVSNEK